MRGNWSRRLAADHARLHARPLQDVVEGRYATGHCAARVREAIAAGGVVLAPVPSAKDYGASLVAAGFVSVGSMSEPCCAGDVVVLQAVAGHVHGHMAIFDGQQWVSDFVQRDMWGGPAYRTARPRFCIYRRWPDLPDGAGPMFDQPPKKVVLPAGTRLFKFTGWQLFAPGPSPWWALRLPHPALAAAGYDALFSQAAEAGIAVADLARSRFAVMCNWNPLSHVQSGLLRVLFASLTRPTLGYHGLCGAVTEARAAAADPRADVVHPGGAHQVLLPDLAAGDLIGQGMQMLG